MKIIYLPLDVTVAAFNQPPAQHVSSLYAGAVACYPPGPVLTTVRACVCVIFLSALLIFVVYLYRDED